MSWRMIDLDDKDKIYAHELLAAVRSVEMACQACDAVFCRMEEGEEALVLEDGEPNWVAVVEELETTIREAVEPNQQDAQQEVLKQFRDLENFKEKFKVSARILIHVYLSLAKEYEVALSETERAYYLMRALPNSVSLHLRMSLKKDCNNPASIIREIRELANAAGDAFMAGEGQTAKTVEEASVDEGPIAHEMALLLEVELDYHQEKKFLIGRGIGKVGGIKTSRKQNKIVTAVGEQEVMTKGMNASQKAKTAPIVAKEVT
eukprot:GHVR01002639.1.p1 GENE.GHVR01002639.1~~GHVR01002639.1.p1  ORF type:complete len:262 (+),score=48.68 GHVR01002639.1:1050-1835(+)